MRKKSLAGAETKGSKVFLKLTCCALAFLLICGPIAPAFAQEAPSSKPSNEASTIDTSPVVRDVPTATPSVPAPTVGGSADGSLEPSKPVDPVAAALESLAGGSDSGVTPKTSSVPNAVDSVPAPEQIDPTVDKSVEPNPKETQVSDTDKANQAKSPSAPQSLTASGALTDPNALPDAGAKQVNLKADQSSGALLYSYPVQLPPGRAGLTPNLSFNYNSQKSDPNSIVSYGWDLSIPYIVRKNASGTDQLYTRNDFTSSEDGDLVLSTTSSTTQTYIPETQSSEFSKYTFDASTSVWSLTTKSGTVFTYGTSTASREDDPANQSHIYRWMLSTITDTNGNNIYYTYTKDGNRLYPLNIHYGMFDVGFTKSAQSPRLQLKSVFSISTAYRISGVNVFVSNATTSQYSVGYASSTVTKPLSQIASIALSNPTTATQTTAFSYTDPVSLGFSESSATYSTSTLADRSLAIDYNGDGITDIASCTTSCTPGSIVYFKNSGTAFATDTSITADIPGTAFTAQYTGNSYVIDINGDSLPDLIVTDAGSNSVYRNTGTGWVLDSSIVIPTDVKQIGTYASGLQTANPNVYSGWRAVDVNGDGIPDFVLDFFKWTNSPQTQEQKVYLSNGGPSWTQSSNFLPPFPVSLSSFNNWNTVAQLSDMNNDGLADILESGNTAVYLNNGNVFASSSTTTFPYPGTNGNHMVLPVDMNGDGYVDFITQDYPSGSSTPNMTDLTASWATKAMLVNQQNGNATATASGTGIQNTLSIGFYPAGYIPSVPTMAVKPFMYGDLNGDGLTDLIEDVQAVDPNTQSLTQWKHFYLNTAPRVPSLLSSVTAPAGATTTVSYKGSPQYKGQSGNLLNPKVPFAVQTVEKIVSTDPVTGVTGTSTYSYADGSLYYSSSSMLTRRFAGFGAITATDNSGNVTKTYLHQGNAGSSASGEYQDSYWKIGKPYRTDSYDASGNLYASTVNKWDDVDLGAGSRFVKLLQTLSQSFDGGAGHKDKAESYTYNDSTGDITQKTAWGEVIGSSDGSFSDTGSDLFTSAYTYAASSTNPRISLLASETVTNQGGTKVKESRTYYDTQSLGAATKGNPTKQEAWKSASTYVNSQKAYNSYGLVTSETDPRGKVTNYSYDANSMYVATSTNPLSQVTTYLYDYTFGKPKQATDPNGITAQVTFDGLGRILEEKQASTSATSTLETKNAYVYTDTPGNISVKKTTNLDAGNGVDSYAYLDGLGRIIQTRTETEDAGQFVVSDTAYNGLGQVARQSLPYFGSGSARAAATTTSALFTNMVYDALGRATSTVNSVGTTTTAFSPWKTTVTDPKGTPKHLYKDAFDNLIRVDEVNGSSTYTTLYAYDYLGDLTGITDALGNVRSFAYDGMGRRTGAQDLHTLTDPTFGSYSYSYDDGGNLTSLTDPKGQVINYTYDDLSRQLTEDFTGATGTEVSYTYDSCTFGKGRLCTASSTGAIDTNTYDALGRVISTTKTIDGTGYTTSYSYDRQGNQLEITSPDNSKVKYTYSAGGQLETIQRKETTDGSYTNVVTDFDYGPHGKTTYQANQNGTQTTSTYDAAKLYRLIAKLTTNAGSTKLQDLAYTYDPNGNITQLVDNSQVNTKKTVGYAYDPLNRLTQASSTGAVAGQNFTENYAYDAVGNILIKSDLGSYSYELSTATLAQYTTGGTWTNRKQITLDHTKVSGTSTISNFPVLISLTDTNLKATSSGGYVGKADGGDILFTSADGTTKLSHEIESYSSTTGSLVAWVKVPSLSPVTDTNLIVYFGNASSSNQQDTTNVWDSNFKGVWHLGTGLNDSTSNAKNLTNGGAATTTGQIQSARYFNGSSTAYTTSLPTTVTDNYTMSAWVNVATTSTTSQVYISNGYDSGSSGGGYSTMISGGNYRMQINMIANLDSGVAPSYGTWQQVAMVRNSGTSKLYLNGSQIGSTLTNGPYTPTDAFSIGGQAQSVTPTFYRYLTGSLDEVRVSATPRAPEWIATEYQNQSTPSTFYSYYGPVTLGGSSGTYANPHAVVAIGTTATSTNGTSVEVAQGKSISASSQKGGFEATKANDGNDSSYWEATDFAYPSYITVNLGSSTSVTKVAFGVPPAWGSRVENVEVQQSTDGTNFSTLVAAANHTIGSTTVSVATTTLQYVRLKVNSNSGANAAQVSKFEVYGFTPTQAFTANQTFAYDQNGNITQATGQSTAAPWYQTGGSWSKRKSVSVAPSMVSGSSTLSNFPLLVSVTDAELKATSSSGYMSRVDAGDIVFTAADGTTKLSHEIESYNQATGNIVAWVKVPSLSPNATTSLVLYYGGPAATNQQDATNVWDSNQKGVWHMGQNPAGTAPQITDSTGNANHGTTGGSMVAANSTSSQIATGLNLDGSDDYINAGSASNLDNLAQVTAEGWIYNTQNQPETFGGRIFDKRNNNSGWVFLVNNTNNLRFLANFTGGTTQKTSSDNTFGLNSWQHVAATWDGTSNSSGIKLYVNGVEVGSQSTTTGSGSRNDDSGENLNIGECSGWWYCAFKGKLDELRVSNTVRSSDYIKTSYQNQSAPGTYVTLGAMGTGSATTTYAWDYVNRMTGVNGGATASYAYDASGQRAKAVQGGSTTYYPSKVYSIEAGVPSKYIYAGDTMIAQVKGTGTSSVVTFAHVDHLNSTQVVSNASGTATQVTDYLPYGGTRVSEGPDTKKQFIGQFFDQSTGLNYLNARYYNGTIGKFTSQDALFWRTPDQYIIDPQQWNGYSYARTNPINNSDPSGDFSASAIVKSITSAVKNLFASHEGNSLPTTNEIHLPNIKLQTRDEIGADGGRQETTRSKPAQKASQQSGATPLTWDVKATDPRIRGLDPRVQPHAVNFVNRTQSELGIQLRVTDGFRSSEQQEALYWQSRTNPPTGPWATNARGGQSNHNFGLAIDVTVMENGKAYAHPINSDIVNIAKQEGFQWGGDWPAPITDYPHFEMTFPKD